MAVNIYSSNTFRGAFDGLTKALKENLQSDNIIIVPDRFTLTIEKEVLDKLNLAGSMNINVMSFSRLAAVMLENKIHRCLTPESAVMLLAKVIKANKDSLACYGKVRDISALSKELYAAISSIRNSGITPDMLRAALGRINNPGVRKKTDDIILLLTKYLNELEINYHDSTTRLDKLAEEIPNLERIHSSNIYITDFFFFTQIEIKVIKALIKHCKSMHIALIKPAHNAHNTRIYPEYNIEAIASASGAIVKEYCAEYSLDRVNSVIEKRLFSYSGEREDAEDKIRLYYAPHIESEITAMTREIRRLIINGARYKDIAVVCPDINTYTPYIERIFNRFDIPYYIDRSKMLKDHPLIRLLLSAIDFVIEDYSIDYAMDIIKNPFMRIDKSEADIFENFCIKYGIYGRQLFKPFNYTDDENYDISEKIRRKFIKSIGILNNAPKGSAENFIDLILKFMEALQSDATMKELMQMQLDYNDLTFQEVTKQLPEKSKEIFAEIKEMLGCEVMEFHEFATLFSANISSVKISMIPHYIDCVFIGEPLESRYSVIKVLFVIGANDADMPVRRRDNGIITGYEISEWGLDISPTVKQLCNIDKLQLLQLLIKPEHKLIVSYSALTKNEIVNPSTVMTQLRDIFGLEIKSVDKEYEDSYELDNEQRAELYAYKFSSVKNAMRELTGALRRIKERKTSVYELIPYDTAYKMLDMKDREIISEINNLYKDARPFIRNGHKVFFSKERTSVSQLENYFTCPYKHFLRYGVGAKIREEKEIKSNIRGLIVHKALEIMLKSYDKESGKDRFELIKSVILEVMSDGEFSRLIEDNKKKILEMSLSKTMNEVLDCIDKSRFKPFLFEVDLGLNDAFTIEYEKGRSIAFKGIVDRVDKMGDYLMVIDYKTGYVGNTIKELKYGLKIQLFIYLKALLKDNFKPAGALYMLLKDKYVKDNETGAPYYGIIVSDVYNEFDVYGDMLKKSCVKESGELHKMIDYAVDISKQAIREIIEGYIEQKPYQGACNRCDYFDICRSRLENISERKGVNARNIGFGGGND
jgi:ATP-dependent helicase/nuclease subunit B